MYINIYQFHKKDNNGKFELFDNPSYKFDKTCHENILLLRNTMINDNFLIGMNLNENKIILDEDHLKFYLKTLNILQAKYILINTNLKEVSNVREAKYIAMDQNQYENAGAFYIFWVLIRYMLDMTGQSNENKDEQYLNDPRNQYENIIKRTKIIKEKYPRWQTIKCLQLAHVIIPGTKERIDLIEENLKHSAKQIESNINLDKLPSYKLQFSRNSRLLFTSELFSIISQASFIYFREPISISKIINMEQFIEKINEQTKETKYPGKFLTTEIKEIKASEGIQITFKIIDSIKDNDLLKLKKIFDNDF